MNHLFKFLPPVFVLLLTISACKNSSNDFDASGNFEAEETIVSSEASGKVVEFTIAEGQQLKANEVIGYIDTTDLFRASGVSETTRHVISTGHYQRTNRHR
jgi:HlyD family secretion protein